MHRQGVWTIAGFDPAGLAGILVDVATINNLGVQAGAIVTAVTAQNAYTIHAMEPISAPHVLDQCRTLQLSFNPKAIKLGMLGSIEIAYSLCEFLAQYEGWVVMDPILASSSSFPLFIGNKDVYLETIQQLFSYVDLLTPNIPEAELLAQHKIASYDDMHYAANKILHLGAKAVLIKGGHSSDECFSQDLFLSDTEFFFLVNQRVTNKNYRGTGCALSSAIAACLAKDYAMSDALINAKAYVHCGIRQALDLDGTTAQLFHGPYVLEDRDKPYVATKPVQGLLTN